ncbi:MULTISPECIES: DUF4307 domain-containing protein [unclassified Streptomyces]|uniref:DUF4307 domain-containing protein n=1 Tax=Streptomycetaceae TaxID=2062 RepID=UPI002E79B03E|nr:MULTISPECIES: DUF4307 domain-containing protein [unclassified Streptomyces]MED7948359.1 DUF4307 domain-containing protein [Streptomyces sp. BE303]MEE1823914.1 DUF4307 domain-containing protein [Streptomyces sp. BE20]
MTAGTRTPQLPEGRYGRRGDREADRRLKVIGAVCGVLALGLVTWLGASYLIRETKINGAVPSFEAVSDVEMQLHLSVRKSDGTAGSCTVRSQGENGAVVGVADFPVPADGSGYDAVVSLRTTSRGTTAELLGCTPA